MNLMSIDVILLQETVQFYSKKNSNFIDVSLITNEPDFYDS